MTMELNDEARPIHTDATMKLRPRLFLEGNLFVDLQPGSPNADEVDDEHTFPINQTSYSVQLDQVLTTLQGDVRADLQTFLDQFGNALTKYGGAEGFRELYRSSPGAFKYTSQVNEALLGTQPHDLSGVITNLDEVVDALDRNETALKDLVTNFATVTGSFAPQDQAPRARRLQELPDVLEAPRPGVRQPQRVVPAAARLRPRGAARRALDARDARRVDAVRRADPRAGRRRTSCAASPPTCARRSRSWRSWRKRTIPFLDATRAALELLQRGRHPVVEHTVEPVDPGGQYPHDRLGHGRSRRPATGSRGSAGEPLGRRQRPVHPGRGRRRRQHRRGPDRCRSAAAAACRTRSASTAFPLLGAIPSIDDSAQDPVQAERPLRDAGAAEPRAQAGGNPSASRADTPRAAELRPHILEPGDDASQARAPAPSRPVGLPGRAGGRRRSPSSLGASEESGN